MSGGACEGPRGEPIRDVIQPRSIDLGGFLVRRALPARTVPAVGPWVFLDHIGPASFPPGKGVDVIPHPHINLATVTYLFEGEIVHRDSLGNVQTITPGAVNLMVAARGIVHSERSGPELRAAGHRVHGLQLWFALPEDHEEDEPSFTHYAAETLPGTGIDGARVRVMIGKAYGLKSPVQTLSPTLYAEADVPGGGSLPVPEGVEELAVYPVSGSLKAGGARLPAGTLCVLAPGMRGRLSAREPSRFALIGGTPLGRRHMWWNFVSSRRQRIEEAKADWKANRMGGIPGESERHPLPERDAFLDKAGQ